ncbi:hypothetical protein LCGC14_1506310, partial [marine sediment metagenome]
MVIIISKEEDLKKSMDIYEKETGKKAIWHGKITESFKKWKKGETIINDNKERISLLITKEIKNKWQKFASENNITTVSKLIRKGVNYYMNLKSKRFDFENISTLIHYLKEPLTTIKGYSEILIENHKQNLEWDVLLKIRDIFDQSSILEKRIDNLALDKTVEDNYYDILIVDDDHYTIKLLTDFFENSNYKCGSVFDGRSTLEFLEMYSPKLILLDIILPDISGYDICKEIKSRKKFKNIPIYYITAIPLSDVKKHIKITGADGYFIKPFKMPE